MAVKAIGRARSRSSLALPACAQAAAAQGRERCRSGALGGQGQRHDVYLFGTIHVLKPGLTWFDEAVRQRSTDRASWCWSW